MVQPASNVAHQSITQEPSNTFRLESDPLSPADDATHVNASHREHGVSESRDEELHSRQATSKTHTV